MIETKETRIDGDVYTVTQLPARRAIKLKAKLIKLFGAALAQFFTSSEINTNQVVKVIETLSLTIDENAFESLVVELLQGVRKNGLELIPATIDLEFAGDIGALYQVLWFVIETNFSNFFTLIGITLPSFSTDQEVDSVKLPSKKIFARS